MNLLQFFKAVPQFSIDAASSSAATAQGHFLNVDRRGATLKLNYKPHFFLRLYCLLCFYLFVYTLSFSSLISRRHVSWQIVCGLQPVTFCHKATALTSGSLLSSTRWHNDMLCLLRAAANDYLLSCVINQQSVFVINRLFGSEMSKNDAKVTFSIVLFWLKIVQKKVDLLLSCTTKRTIKFEEFLLGLILFFDHFISNICCFSPVKAAMINQLMDIVKY